MEKALKEAEEEPPQKKRKGGRGNCEARRIFEAKVEECLGDVDRARKELVTEGKFTSSRASQLKGGYWKHI